MLVAPKIALLRRQYAPLPRPLPLLQVYALSLGCLCQSRGALLPQPRSDLRRHQQREVTELYPEVMRAIACLPATRAAFDGELVVLDGAGRSSLGLLRSRAFGRLSPGRWPPRQEDLFEWPVGEFTEPVYPDI